MPWITSLGSRFSSKITNELTSWFQIRADYYNKPAMKDAALVVDLNEIAERIVAMEEFQFTFPYSKYNHELIVCTKTIC